MNQNVKIRIVLMIMEILLNHVDDIGNHVADITSRFRHWRWIVSMKDECGTVTSNDGLTEYTVIEEDDDW